MKKTRYYLDILMPGGSYHDWKDVCHDASKSGMLLYKNDNDEIYTYEYNGEEFIPGSWNWPVSLNRTEEVEIEQTVVKLPPDNKYKNGYNWKNAHIKGANSRLKKKNSNDVAAEKAQRDAEFFKMREEFRKRNNKK